MNKKLILVLGGARSGKSAFAEQLAGQIGERVLFVATAAPGDEEMQQRIEIHRRRRPTGWRTVEASEKVGEAIRRHLADAQVVLLDCLTLLASNILMRVAGEEPSGEEAQVAEGRIGEEVEEILESYEAGSASLIVVSNEVGLGLVPPYPLGRVYRDVLGRANQLMAARADQIFFMIAGLPIDLRQLQAVIGQAKDARELPERQV